MKLPAEKDYPAEVCCGEESYQIFFRHRLPGKDTVGLCDSGSREIFLKKGLSKSQLFRTATHEFLHMIDEEHEVGLSHKQVYLLEKAIVDFLLTNF